MDHKDTYMFMSEEKRIEWYAKELQAVRDRIAECERVLASGSFTHPKGQVEKSREFIEASLKTWRETEAKIVDGVLQRETREAVERFRKAYPNIPFGKPEHFIKKDR
jgi:hypothetical protein